MIEVEVTQILYNLELKLQISADGSTFTILGSNGSKEQLGKIIDKLKQWQFAIDDSVRGNFIHFRALPVPKEEEYDQ